MSSKGTYDLLIRNVDRIATMNGGEPGPIANPTEADLGMIENGALVALADEILAVGVTSEIEASYDPAPGAVVLEGGGRCLLPGFVDPHTHFLFAGIRDEEYAMRVAGVDYQEIRRRGGGIRSTVRSFREASDETLFETGRRRLDTFLANGTTTVEGKSGYGLSTTHERRALEIMDRLHQDHPIDVVTTFLGAHDIPPEYDGRKDDYVRLVIEEMIPAMAPLARFCDVFCEEGYFDVEQSRAIFEAGKKHGLIPKLHAEEFVPMGGGELAAEVGAISADHLLVVTDQGVEAMAAAGVIAIFLPGTTIGLARPGWADPPKFRRHGQPMALATDCNPGSSYTESMPSVISLACSLLRMTVPEALLGATRNSAAAIGVLDHVGTLEPGKKADCILISSSHPFSIPYRFGSNLVETVIKNGRVAVTAG